VTALDARFVDGTIRLRRLGTLRYRPLDVRGDMRLYTVPAVGRLDRADVAKSISEISVQGRRGLPTSPTGGATWSARSIATH
jgi:hypothetical protein